MSLWRSHRILCITNSFSKANGVSKDTCRTRNSYLKGPLLVAISVMGMESGVRTPLCPEIGVPQGLQEDNTAKSLERCPVRHPHTCAASPAQGSVLPQHPAHGLLILSHGHSPGQAESLPVVSHQRAVTHSGACSSKEQHLTPGCPPPSRWSPEGCSPQRSPAHVPEEAVSVHERYVKWLLKDTHNKTERASQA